MNCRLLNKNAIHNVKVTQAFLDSLLSRSAPIGKPMQANKFLSAPLRSGGLQYIAVGGWTMWLSQIFAHF